MAKMKHIVGTSGYSFRDWVGTFYPPGTQQKDMLGLYVQRFETVELNFTYYRMPTADTLMRIAGRSPEGFTFWVKANQLTTHERDRGVVGQFVEALQPMRVAGKLSGVLLQFPQSFHRTVENRKYLAATLDDFTDVPSAVEFRHRSWEHESTLTGLRDRDVALVIPDVPGLPGLYHWPIAATSTVGYLRLHSRNADKWYAGGAERYDYNYSDAEMKEFAAAWGELDNPPETVFTFFNNCHRGQAATNAEAFREIVEGL